MATNSNSRPDATPRWPPLIYRDLRQRNLRRASRARVVAARRREDVDRAIQVARQRRFRRTG